MNDPCLMLFTKIVHAISASHFWCTVFLIGLKHEEDFDAKQLFNKNACILTTTQGQIADTPKFNTELETKGLSCASDSGDIIPAIQQMNLDRPRSQANVLIQQEYSLIQDTSNL